MTTKERILKEALALFSERGYQAVYVGDIAKAVGIKAPSLYKHYKSKKEIFTSCVDVFIQRICRARDENQLPGTPSASFTYEEVSKEMLVEKVISMFLFYMQDEIASKIRKILLLERYRDKELNQLFEQIFINDPIEREEKTFAMLIAAGILEGADPHTMALHFYSPIFFLLQKYDMYPEETEKACQELANAVGSFCKIYGRKKERC